LFEDLLDRDVVEEVGVRRFTLLFEVGVFGSPCRIGLNERHGFFIGSSTGKFSRPNGEGTWAPLTKRVDVGRAMLSDEIAGEVVAPREKGYLEVNFWSAVGGEAYIVRASILEAVTSLELNVGK
jgi:hypothetical protein